ncbi:MAG: hypothetical protein MUE88_04675 [Flavobacteriales bacterium]|jgi:hypothetical protein|nr:hypothetical protein [Flavobacteriales bacterium]
MRTLFFVAGGLLLLASCGGGSGTPEPQPTADERPELVIGDGASANAASLYQMPTPNELFVLVRDMAGEGHRKLLNPAVNADKYASLAARALNFGVYSTDLVYASYFKLNVEVARYYLTTKKLAEGLGIASAFTDADFVRLESNLTRGDSLETISSAAYQRAYEKLQSEEMGPTLSLVLAGGWVESMHLVMRQIEAFGESPALMTRVAEQKVTLEHLVALMEPHAKEPEVSAIHKELVAIRDIYDRVNMKRVPHKGTTTSGRMVLGDDVEIDLTAEKYAELVKAVDQLRARITRPEDQTNA